MHLQVEKRGIFQNSMFDVPIFLELESLRQINVAKLKRMQRPEAKSIFWWTIAKIGCKRSQRRFFFSPGRHQMCQHAPVFLTDAGQRLSRRSCKQISDWALEIDVVDCSTTDTVRKHNEQFFHCLPAFAVCGSWLAGHGDNNRGEFSINQIKVCTVRSPTRSGAKGWSLQFSHACCEQKLAAVSFFLAEMNHSGNNAEDVCW